MSEATLSLGGELAVPGGAIELTGVSRHRGEEAVARFHAWLGDRYREVELRVGDAALAGEVAFQLRRIDVSAGSATFVLQETPRAAAEAPYGEPFDIALGARVTFPTGQALSMTGVGRFGVEVSFEDSDGCENFRWFDFGFWRDDGLLFEVVAADRQRGSVRLLVQPEERVNRELPAAFEEVVSLGARDVVRYPDGSTVRFRWAQRHCYDAVSWRLLATNGEDVSYLYAGESTTHGEPGGDEECSFGLLGRSYVLTLLGAQLEPQPILRFSVQSESTGTFALGVPEQFSMLDFREGPDGLMLGYRGSAHAHGTAMGPDGELVPTTEAWAGFGVVLDGVRSGFNVDLLDFDDPAVEELVGYRFTVSAVSDSFAVVRVDRVGAADVEDDSGW